MLNPFPKVRYHVNDMINSRWKVNGGMSYGLQKIFALHMGLNYVDHVADLRKDRPPCLGEEKPPVSGKRKVGIGAADKAIYE